MSTNGIGTQMQTAAGGSRRRKILTYGLAFRLFIAYIISWLIIVGFFVTGAVSH